MATYTLQNLKSRPELNGQSVTMLDNCWKSIKRRLAVQCAGTSEDLLVRAKNLHSSRFVIMDELVLGSKEVLLPSAVLLDRDCSANFINFGNRGQHTREWLDVIAEIHGHHESNSEPAAMAERLVTSCLHIVSQDLCTGRLPTFEVSASAKVMATMSASATPDKTSFAERFRDNGTIASLVGITGRLQSDAMAAAQGFHVLYYLLEQGDAVSAKEHAIALGALALISECMRLHIDSDPLRSAAMRLSALLHDNVDMTPGMKEFSASARAEHPAE